MLNNKEIAEKLEQIKCVVTSYIYKNMNEQFKDKMFDQEGSVAIFKTTEGSEVKFRSYRGFMERYVVVETEGQIMDKPFEFNFRSSMFDYGTGTVFSGKYGLAFWNVGDDEKEPIVKPFRNILGKKVYRFANKAFDEILPLIEQFSKDIETITPDEETKAYLKKQEKPRLKIKKQKKSITSERKYLENKKTKLASLYTFPKSLANNELSKKLSKTKSKKKSIASERKYLENLKAKLVSLYSLSESLNNDKLRGKQLSRRKRKF